MTTALETPTTVVAGVPVPAEVRHAALDRAVAELARKGWTLETKPDYKSVLVGNNEFRQLMTRRQWGIKHQRELVDVDKHGNISIQRV